ncbi:hypothetical protein BH10PSE19_BH10PSE19_16290 [soil metagenome]
MALLPTPSEYFHLSQAVSYAKRGSGLSAWQVHLTTPNDQYSAGYIACAFRNEQTKHIVIASTILNSHSNEALPQQRELDTILDRAYTFANFIIAWAQKNGHTVSFTGYALGAIPAEQCALTHNVHAVVFQSPAYQGVVTGMAPTSDKVVKYSISFNQ